MEYLKCKLTNRKEFGLKLLQSKSGIYLEVSAGKVIWTIAVW
jgi:hypothetical protein